MHVRNSYFSLPVEVFGGKMPANWLFKCWLLLLLSLAMKGAASNDPDEDEIIQQAMAEDHHLMVNDLIKRAETNYNINDVNDIQVQEVPPPGVAPQKLHKGPGAENIVGDMKKYGLWEYSTDTTGMGDQLKEMIKNSKDVDPQADVSSDTLLKHAEKINTEINKYAEQLPTQGPTIDPYDTPLGYQPPPVNPSNPEVKQHETDNVINLPETPIVVEDEHGNNLDNFQQKGGPPTTPKPSATAAMASGMSSPQPTTALTLKLLNALKNSKSFLLNAQKLLDAPGDTDEELFNKQKSLLNYLKDYETDKTQAKANQEKEVHLLKPKVEVKLANTSGDNSNVLNRVVQYLSAHDPATKVSDILGVLKKAVDGVGPPGSKPAEEVNSIKSPPGTPDKPLKPDLSPTKKPVIPTKTLTTTQKPKPTQTSLNPLGLSGSSLNPLSLAGMSMDKVGVAGSHMTPTKSSKADDNNGISKDMLDMIFKMYNKEKKEEQTGDEKTHDDGSKPSSAGPLGIDKVNEKVSAANDKDKNTDKEKLMLDKLMQLTNKGDDLHKLTEANGHIETKDMNQKTNDVSSSSHQDKEKEKEKEKPVPPKIETTYTSTTTTNNNNNKTKEDAVGDKMYEYLKNTNEFKKLVAEHMKMFESANNLTHIQDVGPTINNKTKESKEQGSIPNESVKNITSSSKGPVATDQPKQNDKAEPPSTQSQQNVKIEAKPEEAIQSPQPASSNGGEKIDPNLSKKLEEIRKEKERLQREEEELKKMQQKPSNPEPLANTDNIKPNVIGNVDHQAQLMRERQPEDLTEAISNGKSSYHSSYHDVNKNDPSSRLNAMPSLQQVGLKPNSIGNSYADSPMPVSANDHSNVAVQNEAPKLSAENNFHSDIHEKNLALQNESPKLSENNLHSDIHDKSLGVNSFPHKNQMQSQQNEFVSKPDTQVHVHIHGQSGNENKQYMNQESDQEPPRMSEGNFRPLHNTNLQDENEALKRLQESKSSAQHERMDPSAHEKVGGGSQMQMSSATESENAGEQWVSAAEERLATSQEHVNEGGEKGSLMQNHMNNEFSDKDHRPISSDSEQIVNYVKTGDGEMKVRPQKSLNSNQNNIRNDDGESISSDSGRFNHIKAEEEEESKIRADNSQRKQSYNQERASSMRNAEGGRKLRDDKEKDSKQSDLSLAPNPITTSKNRATDNEYKEKVTAMMEHANNERKMKNMNAESTSPFPSSMKTTEDKNIHFSQGNSFQERENSNKLPGKNRLGSQSIGNVLHDDDKEVGSMMREKTSSSPLSTSKIMRNNYTIMIPDTRSPCQVDKFSPHWNANTCKPPVAMSAVKSEDNRNTERKHRLPMHNPLPKERLSEVNPSPQLDEGSLDPSQDASSLLSPPPPPMPVYSPEVEGDSEGELIKAQNIANIKAKKLRLATTAVTHDHILLPSEPIMLRQGISPYPPIRRKTLPFNYILSFLKNKNITSSTLRDYALASHHSAPEFTTRHDPRVLDINADKRGFSSFRSVEEKQRKREAFKRLLWRYILAKRHYRELHGDGDSHVRHVHSEMDLGSGDFGTPQASVIVPSRNYASHSRVSQDDTSSTNSHDVHESTRSKLPKMKKAKRPLLSTIADVFTKKAKVPNLSNIADVFKEIGSGDKAKRSKTDYRIPHIPVKNVDYRNIDIDLKNLILK